MKANLLSCIKQIHSSINKKYNLSAPRNTVDKSHSWKMQLTCCQKVRALTLRGCGWTLDEVAADLDVTVRTIQRLVKNVKVQKSGKDVAPLRRPGSGRKRSFGKKQIEAIDNLINEEPGLTCHQVKLRLGKTLAGVSRKTIQRIINVTLPSRVRPKLPLQTKEGRKKRLVWAKKHLRKTISEWREVLFCDESPFQTKQSTGGRNVRRPRSADRFDPKYTKPRVRKPATIIFWGGISASGTRVHGFFKPKEMVNSSTYISMLKKKAVPVLKQENLTLCHDRAPPHTSKSTRAFLAKEGIKTMHTPGGSPDAMPIENIFGLMKRRLEDVPTRNLEELKSEVVDVWRNLPVAYLEEICTSMRRRCLAIIRNNGYPTKY